MYVALRRYYVSLRGATWILRGGYDQILRGSDAAASWLTRCSANANGAHYEARGLRGVYGTEIFYFQNLSYVAHTRQLYAKV